MMGKQGVRRSVAGVLLALTTLLASCGGGGGGSASDRAGTTPTAAATRFRNAMDATVAAATPSSGADLRALPLAATTRASADAAALEVAEQLMDFAEVVYPGYFPGHPTTDIYEGYLYRYYAGTGAYLGVRDGSIYVMGGPFGDAITSVGPLAQFITPAPLKRDPCLGDAANYGVHATSLPAVGRGAGALIAGCSGTIGSPQWKQTAGPAVALMSEQTQVISFDPTVPGTYRFEVSFIDPRSQARTESVIITVPAAAAPPLGVTARLNQAVRSGGNVSLRAWPRVPEGEQVRSVSWRQLEGPTVSFDTDMLDDRLATFKAPSVTRDTLLRFRATVLTASGLSASDDVLVLVENFGQVGDQNAVWANEHVQRVHPYRSGTSYAGDLVRCSYDPRLIYLGLGANLCSLRQLPLLSQSGGDIPSIDQVLDRVLVSHDWMGRNFETLLRTRDPNGDIRRMLRSVTTVVIGSQIRPSFYNPLVATIFLDADNFWITPEERDSINEVPDFRAAFGKELQYDGLWRYVKDGRSISRYYDSRERESRTMDDVHFDAMPLLYHELGHALDFLPPADYGVLDTRLSPWGNMLPRYNSYRNTSDVVGSLYPLESSVMYDLADVRYAGATPTARQKAYTPDDVAGFFSADHASDPYAYRSDPEDTAMLLEEFLMRYRLGIARDVAFSAAFTEDDTSATIIVRWGQRGRVAQSDVRVRAREVVRQLVPWINAAEVDSLPATQPLQAGRSWRDNLAQSIVEQRVQPLGYAPNARDVREFRRERQRMRERRAPPRPGEVGSR